MKRLYPKFLLIFLLAMSATLMGCIPGTIKSENTEKHKGNSVTSQEVKHHQADQVSKMSAADLKNLPGWVSEQPTTDLSGFYGVGIGSDRDLLGSVQLAKQQAVKQLAQTIKLALADNDSDPSVINRFVDQLDLSNSQLVKQKVQPSNGRYQSYVLMRYSYQNFTRQLKQSRQSEDELQTLDEAYHRLMKKVGRE